MNSIKKNITIFAGGLGTRLNGSEAMPKPLVDINGIPLIQRIIDNIISSGQFDQIIILKCKDKYSDNYQNISFQYKELIKIKVLEENERTGRTGAIKYLFDSELNIEESFFCNGDTLLENTYNLKYDTSRDRKDLKPIVYLANADINRNDYKRIAINNMFYQNSGYFMIKRKWFNDAIKDLEEIGNTDIDDLLFSQKNVNKYSKLECNIFDAGTPERLKFVRDIFK